MFDLPSIPVTFPEKEIFLRLEGNIYKTELDEAENSDSSVPHRRRTLCADRAADGIFWRLKR